MSKPIRLQQRKSEAADLLALRAFITALPLMSDNAVRAFARYVWDKSADVLEKRSKDTKP